ncbi:MAG: glycerol-3-phosphate dehydrogenase, partial [Oxalobacteraceae bacterium]
PGSAARPVQPLAWPVAGGKITTYRRLAEAALAKLGPHLPPATGQANGWTGRAALPGGDFAIDGFDALLQTMQTRYPFVAARTMHRLVRAYGTRTETLLAGATSAADLGRVHGADLTDAELRYLINHEWARTAADVVWRRSKLGLRLTKAEIAEIDDAMAAMLPQRDHAA